MFFAGTFITLVPLFFRKRFGLLAYMFACVNTLNYSINFFYYLINPPLDTVKFQAMLLHVTACMVVYIVYLFLTKGSKDPSFSLTNAQPYFKYLIYPAFFIYVAQIFRTKTLFADVLSDARNFTYDNLISNLLYPFQLIVTALVLKIILSNDFKFKHLLFVTTIFSITFARSLMAGSKSGILGLIWFYGLIYFYKYGIKAKLALTIILLLIPSMFFFVSMANIRQSIAENNVWQDFSLSQKIDYVYEKSLTLNYSENFSKLPETVAKRLHGIDSLSRFLERTPSVYPYFNGASYSEVFIGMIPRVMWLEKKIDDFANQISYNYFDNSFATNTSSFIWGEPYLNFGIPGIYTFAIIVGICLVLFEQILNFFRKDLYIYTFCLFTFYSFIATEGNATRVIPGMIAKVIFFSLIFFVLATFENRKTSVEAIN